MRARALWPLLLGALLVCPARADDEEPPPEEHLSLPELFQLLGEGHEQAAEELLAPRAAAEIEAQARASLATIDSARPARLLGAAVWAGAHLDRDACGQLLRGVRARLSEPAGPDLRAALLEASGALGDVSGLQQWLLRGKLDDASSAARGMCRCAHPSALPSLLRAIEQLEQSATEEAERRSLYPDAPDSPGDLHSATRLQGALEALRWFAGSRHAERLARALQDGGSPSLPVLETLLGVRDRAARLAAGQIGYSLFADDDPARRALGVKLMVGSRNRELRGPIGDALRDDAPLVRAVAAGAVVDLQIGPDIPRVIGLLDDLAPEVRSAAHQALVRLARQEIPGRRQDWERWWEQEKQRRAQ